MSKETEFKFLVTGDSYKAMATESLRIEQGYISKRPQGTARVRIKGDKAYLTIKGMNHGATRDEWEYPIPVEEAGEMLERVCEDGIIQKTRWIVPYKGFTWEVDEFHGHLEGLTVAEVELPDEHTPLSEVPLPGFAEKNVTGDPQYYNSNLSNKVR